VLLEHGTEAAFCGVFLDEKREGVYTCLCGLPPFKACAKFESGTGWPSFTTPFAENHLRSIRDSSHGMVRTEIACSTKFAKIHAQIERSPWQNVIL
jgi:peptide-methionine (R)-S-oxide reductase